MANVKCSRKTREIDLLAMNPKTQERFHVEARVTRTGFKIRKEDTVVQEKVIGRVEHTE